MRIKTRIQTTLEGLRTNFWFIPTTMFLCAILLAKLFIAFDQSDIFRDIALLEFIYRSDANTIVSLLTMVAGSMITVTSIVFSITVLSLSMASSQFGPRLIRHFMADTGTKMVLGTFLATFIYCLMVIEVTDEFQSLGKIPGMSVYVAVFLVSLSIFVLILFIHHVARSIQADQVISDVESRLEHNIHRLFPDKPDVGGAIQNSDEDDVSLPDKYSECKDVEVKASGYIQAIDYKTLFDLALKEDCAIEITYLPGNLIIEKSCLLKVFYQAENNLPGSLKQMHDCVVLGSQRTPVQDPEFAVHQLVEIAVRALSPGVNDPYSAMTCVDKLTAVMCKLTERPFPETYLVDENDVVRLKRKQLRFSDIGKAAFDQIRQFSIDSLAVTIRLLEGLQFIASRATQDEHRQFVSEQLQMIEQIQRKQDMADGDRNDLENRINLVRQKI